MVRESIQQKIWIEVMRMVIRPTSMSVCTLPRHPKARRDAFVDNMGAEIHCFRLFVQSLGINDTPTFEWLVQRSFEVLQGQLPVARHLRAHDQHVQFLSFVLREFVTPFHHMRVKRIEFRFRRLIYICQQDRTHLTGKIVKLALLD